MYRSHHHISLIQSVVGTVHVPVFLGTVSWGRICTRLHSARNGASSPKKISTAAFRILTSSSDVPSAAAQKRLGACLVLCYDCLLASENAESEREFVHLKKTRQTHQESFFCFEAPDPTTSSKESSVVNYTTTYHIYYQTATWRRVANPAKPRDVPSHRLTKQKRFLNNVLRMDSWQED
jgi:hypothetical protein